MSDLTDFLLARIAEDEAVAKDAALGAGAVGFGEERIANGKHWANRYHEVVRPVVPDVSDRHTIADCGGFGGLPIAPHIARHDPARVLAECEAKRRIVDVWIAQWSIPEEGYPSRPLGGQGGEVYFEVLCHLAGAYADHPDYREEWRP